MARAPVDRIIVVPGDVEFVKSCVVGGPPCVLRGCLGEPIGGGFGEGSPNGCARIRTCVLSGGFMRKKGPRRKARVVFPYA